MKHHGADRLLFGVRGSGGRQWEGAEREGLQIRVVELPVAIDALAVIVHPDNPVPVLTLAQLDAIYSQSLRRGAPARLVQWSQLGIDAMGEVPITACSRNRESGASELFRRTALYGGRYADDQRLFPSARELAEFVAATPGAIGVVGMGYVNDGVRALPLAVGAGVRVPPTRAGVLAGTYPLRSLMQVRIPLGPNGRMSDAQRAVAEFILSRDGQDAVHKFGHIRIPAGWITAARALLD
jgi:phosphate transport system substrate-binding protein